MKTVWVVQRNDAFSGEGWEPVYICDTKDEADMWVVTQKKNDETYERRGQHYRLKTCGYIKR